MWKRSSLPHHKGNQNHHHHQYRCGSSSPNQKDDAHQSALLAFLKPPQKTQPSVSVSVSLCLLLKQNLSLWIISPHLFLLPSASPTNQGPQQKSFRVQTTQDKQQQQPSSLHKKTPPKPENNKTKLPSLYPLEPSQKLHPREAQRSFVHGKKKTPKTPKWRKLGEGGKFHNKSKNQKPTKCFKTKI